MIQAIEDYLHQQGWIYAGVSQPDHRIKSGIISKSAKDVVTGDVALHLSGRA